MLKDIATIGSAPMPGTSLQLEREQVRPRHAAGHSPPILIGTAGPAAAAG